MTYPGQSFGDPGSATRNATVVLDADVSNYSAGMGQAAQQTNALGSSVDTLQRRLGGLDKYVGRKLIHFAASDFAALGGATADAATFEKQLSTLSATAAVTNVNFKSMKNGIESTFVKFPVSRSEVIALTEALTNLGVTGTGQLNQLTQTFIKLGAATGENSAGLAQGLVQLSRLMGSTDATQIGNMANSLLTVSKNAGVSATGVLSFAQAIAPMARQAGIGEAAVLGISTAFSKAGADGYVAANTFNSMVSSITQSMQSGSPQLAQYSNLIGVTQTQFKKMDKTTALVDIFNQLTKMGPQAINVLNQMGIDGVRAQSALAAVTQSGDLQQQIATALGSQGNQNNLNKGSAAAMHNLADSMAEARNAFTEFGTVIGTTFLTPMSKVVDVAATATRGLTALIHPVSGLLGLGGAGAGVMAGLGGVAMNAAGLIGTVALSRMVMRGTHVSAFSDAMATQRGVALTGRRAARADESMDRYTGGNMSFMQRRMYEMGLGFGRVMGPVSGANAQPVGSLRRLDTWRNLGLAAPFRALDALNAGQAGMLRESTKSAWDRVRYRDTQPRLSLRDRFGRMVNETAGLSATDVIGQSALRSARGAGDLGNAYIGTGAVQGGAMLRRMYQYGAPAMLTSLIGGLTGMPFAGTLLNRGRRAANGMAGTGTLGEAAGDVGRASKDFWYSMGTAARMPKESLSILSKQAAETSKALGTLALRAGKAAGGTVLGAAWSATGAVAGSAWDMTKMLGRAAFSLPGMAAISGGQYLMGKVNQTMHNGDITDADLNPIQQYNDALGTTTSNLATFSSALVNAAGDVTGTAVTSMKQAAHVGGSDTSNAPNKPKVQAWSDLQANTVGKNSVYTYAAMLGSMPISDPKQLQAAKEDMLAAGIKKDDVQKALDIYMGNGGPSSVSGLQGSAMNYQNLGISAANSEGNGYNFSGQPHGSKSGARMLGSLISGVQSQQQSDAETYGGSYAQQKALGSYAQGLAPLVDRIGSKSSSRDQRFASASALSETLVKIAGGHAHDYTSALMNNTHGVDIHSGMSSTDQQQAVVNALTATKEGRAWLDKLTAGKGTTTDVSMISGMLPNLAKQAEGGFNHLLRTQGGALGAYAASNSTVQAAMGNQQQNPGYVNQAIELLAEKATKLGGGLEGASAQLSKFEGAVGDSNSVLYQQITAAQQLVAQESGYKQPFQTRGKNFSNALTTYQQATSAYDTTPKAQRTNEQYQWVQTTKQAYESSLGDQQQYLQSMYQQAQQYGTQMERAEKDEDLQIQRSKRNFYIQMHQAQQDYQLQESRSIEDHNRQLANQAASAAQSIYDPYTRVQSQYTTDAATLLQNLGDQNERIAQQSAQLKKAKKMGLSQQSIQELDLANPQNAQELNSIIQTLTPAQARKINAEEAKRVKGTKGLTQNKDNLSFAQQEKDYKTSMQRAADDYNRTTKRAEAQQQLSLSDMAQDFHRTVYRAGADLNTAMKEVTGNFGNMYSKTMEQIANSVQRFSPKAAAQMKTDLQGLVDQFPFLLGGDASQYAGGMNSSGQLTTPGTIGVNPQGKVGSYNAQGTFTPASGPYDPSRLPSIGSPTDSGAVAPPAAKSPAKKHPGPKKAALGAITTSSSLINTSEYGQPEAVVPLNYNGVGFMADFTSAVTRAVLQQMHTAGSPAFGSGGGGATHMTVSEDHSTNFTGPVSVQASDPAQLARQLAAKARLSKLAAPKRSH